VKTELRADSKRRAQRSVRARESKPDAAATYAECAMSSDAQAAQNAKTPRRLIVLPK